MNKITRREALLALGGGLVGGILGSVGGLVGNSLLKNSVTNPNHFAPDIRIDVYSKEQLENLDPLEKTLAEKAGEMGESKGVMELYAVFINPHYARVCVYQDTRRLGIFDEDKLSLMLPRQVGFQKYEFVVQGDGLEFINFSTQLLGDKELLLRIIKQEKERVNTPEMITSKDREKMPEGFYYNESPDKAKYWVHGLEALTGNDKEYAKSIWEKRILS